MQNAYTGFSKKTTKQTEPIPGETQIKNDAGGYVYDVGAFKRFERFLILGSEGGTYYVGEAKLTKENALNTIAVIESDGAKAVRTIVEVSDAGRAVKNDAAIFALALAASSKTPATRSLALDSLPKVCRIPTHLFHFLTYVKQFRGFGRGLKRAVGNWYQSQEVERLAYQVVKYQSRDGWSNADALRLSHPKTTDPIRNFLYRWVVDGMEAARAKSPDFSIEIPQILAAFELAKDAPTKELIRLIKDCNLSREMLPTEALKSAEVWEALLEKMPVGAMIRNLGNMSKVGLLTPLSDASRKVVSTLMNKEAINKARIHPIQVLLALKTYAQGKGIRGKGEWEVVDAVKDALNEAFYLSFSNIVPTGKRIVVGVDCSGSMTAHGYGAFSGSLLTPAEAACAMAMVCIRTEQEYQIVAFDTAVRANPQISKNASLESVLKAASGLTGGGTDCGVPIKWAHDLKVKADAFIVITDGQTWAGEKHVSQRLTDYRNALNPKAKFVQITCEASAGSLGNPSDHNVLDVVGFDASVPEAVHSFLLE